MPLIRAEFLRPHQLGRTVLIHDPSQVLYLPFDHDDGSKARDRSGYNNHGVVYGATRVAGKIGSALSFDGVDDGISCDDSDSLDITDEITLEAWVRSSDWSTPNEEHTVIRKGTVYLFRVNANGKMGFALYDTSWHAIWEGNLVLTTNEWHHIVATWNNVTMRMYLDGEQDSSTFDYSGTLQVTADTLTIGTSSVTSPFERFKDIIDELHIYNRALSQAEIRRVMNLRGI